MRVEFGCVKASHILVRFSLLLLLPLLALGLERSAASQQAIPETSGAPSPLSIEQIVQNLVRMNSERSRALRSYQGFRTYRLQYHGFPGDRSAEMGVQVTYQSPGTKEFVIQSASGSKLIIDRVFKKLLQSEQEASKGPMRNRTALNQENYSFTLVGYNKTQGGAVYELKVEPRTKDKFLYRGRIWVDADDFAVVRLTAEPARNPSFWTKNTAIEHVYAKVNDFWLPAHNRSVSDIRLGGRAELTIEYNNYEITNAESLRVPPSADHPTGDID